LVAGKRELEFFDDLHQTFRIASVATSNPIPAVVALVVMLSWPSAGEPMDARVSQKTVFALATSIPPTLSRAVPVESQFALKR